MFDEISEKFTPEFSAEDWVKLFYRANEGDLTSAEMLMQLLMMDLVLLQVIIPIK